MRFEGYSDARVLAVIASGANIATLITTQIRNAASADNALVEVLDTGAKISRNVADANAVLTIDNANASSTGRLINAFKNGSNVFYVGYNGYISSGGLQNTSSQHNAYVQLAMTGVVAQRNIADANAAFTVNQVNTSSTGNIADFQFAGITKAYIDKYGYFATPMIYSRTNINYGSISMGTTVAGTTVFRNVADAYTAFIVNQNNADSTGAIAEFKFTGTTKASIDKDGILTASGYKSSDGSAGATGSFTTADSKTVTVKNGLITSIV